MSEKALIILGLSDSAKLLADYRERWPDHELWTLGRGYMPGSSRHFEIHHDRSLNRAAVELAKVDGVRVMISPFQESTHPLEIPFPLDSVFTELGAAYFELTLDYALSYALLMRARGMLAFDVICLPGHDLNDTVHFMSRGAALYWIGRAQGEGIRVEIPESALLLRRRPSILRQLMPFHQWDSPCYGQPVEVTKPLHARYGWKE